GDAAPGRYLPDQRPRQPERGAGRRHDPRYAGRDPGGARPDPLLRACSATCMACTPGGCRWQQWTRTGGHPEGAGAAQDECLDAAVRANSSTGGWRATACPPRCRGAWRSGAGGPGWWTASTRLPTPPAATPGWSTCAAARDRLTGWWRACAPCSRTAARRGSPGWHPARCAWTASARWSATTATTTSC